MTITFNRLDRFLQSKGESRLNVVKAFLEINNQIVHGDVLDNGSIKPLAWSMRFGEETEGMKNIYF